MVVDNWEVQFQRVQSVASISWHGSTVKAAGRFAIISLRVTNKGLRPDTFVAAGNLVVVDAEGRRYDDDFYATALAMEDRGAAIPAGMNPDASVETLLVYDVSEQSAYYRLVPGILVKSSEGDIAFEIP